MAGPGGDSEGEVQVGGESDGFVVSNLSCRKLNEEDKERFRREKEQYDSVMSGGGVKLPTETIKTSSEPGLLKCIRSGCSAPSVRNVEWEDEYCSNKCVVLHCDQVFNDWVREQKKNLV